MAENSNQNNNQPGIEVKPIKEQKKIHGEFFVTVAVILLLFEAYLFLFLTIPPTSLTNLIIDFFYLIIFIMVFWSYIIVIKTPAGSIPLYWGFYIGYDDEKRKRYCLICNAFKPERSKHCSICNTCVLNMDHHCPWVDNCIGFYNRKHFMQLLIFVTILTIYVDITEAYFVFDMCVKLFKQHVKYSEIIHLGFVVICYVAIFVFSVVITMFLKFHLKLVLDNSTTIESLDQDHKNDNAKFNVGKRQNWEQVFGSEPLLWFFPFPTKRGRPDGDGLSWKIKEPIGDSGFKSNESKNYGINNYEINQNFSPVTK